MILTHDLTVEIASTWSEKSFDKANFLLWYIGYHTWSRFCLTSKKSYSQISVHNNLEIEINISISLWWQIWLALHPVEEGIVWCIYSLTGLKKSLLPLLFFIKKHMCYNPQILTAVLIQVERVKGIITSGVLWMFWLFSVIANIVPFYTKIYLKVRLHFSYSNFA